MIDVQTAAADALLASHVRMMPVDDGVDFWIWIEPTIIKWLYRKGERPCAEIRPDTGGAWDRRRQRRGATVADVLQARYLAATACLSTSSSMILTSAVLVHTVEFSLFCSAVFLFLSFLGVGLG